MDEITLSYQYLEYDHFQFVRLLLSTEGLSLRTKSYITFKLVVDYDFGKSLQDQDNLDDQGKSRYSFLASHGVLWCSGSISDTSSKLQLITRLLHCRG